MPRGLTISFSPQRYYDGRLGSCGCGPDPHIDSMFPWQLDTGLEGVYTAAVSHAFFDNIHTWCGSACGRCFRLTSTGDSPCDDCGVGGAEGESIIVMATNFCPYVLNEQWCPYQG